MNELNNLSALHFKYDKPVSAFTISVFVILAFFTFVKKLKYTEKNL